ncbi:MAG: hypothetical protein ABSG43_24775 [Solirubrobacteraceae bacterium]|jgi:hypothetical protein
MLDNELAAGCDACGGSGIHWPADPDGYQPPVGWSWVERCDTCQRYRSDAAAALVLVERGVGTKARWFERATGRRQRWWLGSDEPASVAINTPAALEAER